MAANEPYGWQKISCNICGMNRKHELYISILIATEDGSMFPYTQTDLCRECWDKFGIKAAFDHNEEIRNI